MYRIAAPSIDDGGSCGWYLLHHATISSKTGRLRSCRAASTVMKKSLGVRYFVKNDPVRASSDG